MYSGHIVEQARVDDLYADPRHPYTLGLLKSIPYVEAKSQDELQPIEGTPPDLTDLPSGCPFAPRCPYVIEKCHSENPPLEFVDEDHLAACWVDVTAGGI